MDVTHQFQKIGVLLTENGFVAVPEEMAVSLMPSVKGYGISGKESPHDG